MVQDQLVEYINSQLKAGVSGDTIKATLVAAGWQSADVDDTLKKVQPTQAVSAAAQPMGMGSSLSSGADPKTVSTAKIEPQTIRVSDLVSASTSDKAMSMSSGTGAKPIDTRAESTKKFLTPSASPASMNFQQSPATRSSAPSSSPSRSSSRGPLTTEILLGVLMVAFGALAAYFLFANRSLSDQVATLTAQSSGVTTQVSTLQNQLDASTTSLTAQVASLTTANQELALDLSFYAVPLGTAATSTSTTILIGSVSGGGTRSYLITTPNGAKVLVANSKDPKVVALVQPLVGTTTVQFGGTYTPGIDSITLTVVNGVSLIAPPAVSPAASSTTSNTTATMTAPASATPSSTGQ
jgi:hypothetical protein